MIVCELCCFGVTASQRICSGRLEKISDDGSMARKVPVQCKLHAKFPLILQHLYCTTN